MSAERNQYRIGFEEITRTAKELTIQNGQHMPLLIIEGSRNQIICQVQAIPDTHGMRMEMMRIFGQAAAKSGKVGRLEQVFFISEGWMSVASEGKLPDLSPSQDPLRKEVLIVSGQDLKEGKKSLKLFEMIRNQFQRVIELPELTPPQEKEEAIEIPLVDAFVEGFQQVFREQAN